MNVGNKRENRKYLMLNEFVSVNQLMMMTKTKVWFYVRIRKKERKKARKKERKNE